MKRGPLLFPLCGIQSRVGLKEDLSSSQYNKVYIIYICFNHAHISSKVISPDWYYTSGKKNAHILPDDHYFIYWNYQIPSIMSTSASYVLCMQCQCRILCCQSQGAEMTQAIFFFADILGAWWGIA